MSDDGTAHWADWFGIASNAVLAASVIVGAGLALRRWNVAFALTEIDSPTYGEVVINGLAQPKTTSWRCRLTLVSGAVAHVHRVKLQRRTMGFWTRVKQGALPHIHMPVSLSTGSGIDIYIVTDRDSRDTYRLKVDEYATLRSITLPFLEPQKQNDFA